MPSARRKILVGFIIILFITFTFIVRSVQSDYNDGFYRPVPGGVKVSSTERYGTSSYVVSGYGINNERGLLIASHVVQDVGDPVYQPDPSRSYYKIGTIWKICTCTDSAIVRADNDLGVSF